MRLESTHVDADIIPIDYFNQMALFYSPYASTKQACHAGEPSQPEQPEYLKKRHILLRSFDAIDYGSHRHLEAWQTDFC